MLHLDLGARPRLRPGTRRAVHLVVQIARRRCIDVLRRPQIEVPCDDGHPSEEFADASPECVAILIEMEESNAVHARFAALAPRERQMLALAFFRDFSYSEIATQLGEPLGTVKSVIRRALAQMRTTLAAEHPERAGRGSHRPTARTVADAACQPA